MASIVSTVLNEIIQVVVTLEADQAELEAGALVKVGQVGSVKGNPVYLYLSENANAS
jgi:hypothetical protein